MRTDDNADSRREPQETTSAAVSVLAYVPGLFFLPLLFAKEEGFARFHGRQSFVLLMAFLVLWLAILVIDLVIGKLLGSIVILGAAFRGLAWLVHNVVGGVLSLAYIGATVTCMIQASLGRRWIFPSLGNYGAMFGL